MRQCNTGKSSLASSVLLAGPVAIAAQLLSMVGGWIVDAHKDDGKRYIVQSDELLSAFLELEATLL